MAIKSPKGKGSTGEYEIIQLLTGWAAEVGVELTLERNLEQVRKGGADVIGVPHMEVEVKRQETLSIPAWWRQVCKAADNTGKTPLLVYRQNRRPWTFMTRQYIAIYAGSHTGVCQSVVSMDLPNAKNWFQHHVWYSTK